MPNIASENTKPIRQALTVLCGMDVQSGATPSAAASSSYDGVNGDVTGVPIFSQFMDLSGDGFLNDGTAQPLDEDHAGIVATVNAAGNSSTLQIAITLSEAVPAGTTLTIYYYENNAEMKRQTVTASGTTASVTITSSTGRINLVKITAGDSWWFNNDSLISCTVSLRGVETKAENPELQISDIEIVGYEPNNVIDKIAMIGTEAPIYYTSGYPGDMSPVRKFYLSSELNWEDKKLTIKGEDASRMLDREYSGAYLGNVSAMNGGNKKYIEAVHNMLTESGIEHEYQNDYTGAPYDTGSAILLPNKTKREILAQAVNLLHCELTGPGSARAPLYLNYVDAGIPRLWTGLDTQNYETIDDIANLKIDTEQMPNRITMQAYVPVIESAESIESFTLAGTVIKDTSDPYYSFSSSIGTITKIAPYKYKLQATGSAKVSGRKITSYSRTTTEEGYELTKTDGYRTITMDDFIGWQFFTDSNVGAITDVLRGLLYREIITYTFTWRGNPKIQPRDHIKVKVDGQYVNMTIDTVTLEHADGGLTSQIVARKGWI